MLRTQVQLPDEVHERLKRFARGREWSLAETIRRAAEEFLERHPPPERVTSDWRLPGPRDLGTRRMTAEQIKGLAQNVEAEEELLRKDGA